MIKITYADLAILREMPGKAGPLSRLGTATSLDSFASKWLISKFLKVVIAEIQEYEKSLIALGQTYGEVVPSRPDSFTVKPENVKVFNEERAKLEAVEVELSILPLPLSVVEQVALTPFDLNALEKFIALPEEKIPLT